jgi:hypothetical protein
MRRRCACGAVAIAVMALSGCVQSEVRRPSKKAGDYHLAIMLFYTNPLDPKADDCQVLTVPSYLSVAKNDKITWDIVNLCGNTKDIDVREFVGEDDPAHKDPVDPDGTSDPKRRLPFKVKASASSDVYKYRVFRGGTSAEDPEIYVER